MKHLAALAAVFIPVAAQSVTLDVPKGRFVYECQLTEICKAGKCSSLDPVIPVTLDRVEGNSKGTVTKQGKVIEVLVFPGLGTHEFLSISAGGSVGYTVNDETGKVSVHTSGGQMHDERGSCSVTNK